MTKADMEDVVKKRGGYRGCPREGCNCGGAISVTSPCCNENRNVVTYSKGRMQVRCGKCGGNPVEFVVGDKTGQEN